MIDKSDYYHGTTILKVLEDNQTHQICFKNNSYLIDSSNLIFLKYTTKSKSPWRFTFSEKEIESIRSSFSDKLNIFFVLICDGDGLCALKCQELLKLLNQKTGWVAVSRKFNKQYSVSGQNGYLEKKIPFGRWPKILFEKEEEINCRRNK
ncbi:MAG: hypothetical protein A2W11_12780 [Ignavibacteria bacterium RBG_16_35_7]|nr:MAG: hypothetical protein A2W11_12780 [Ignavibacteria bacterium RBG_16_35_7]